MPQSMANFDAALKDDYGPGLKNAINNSNPVFTEVMINDQDIVGRQAVWSVHTGRSTSTGARGELASLPSADRQRFTQMQEKLAYLYHTIKVSGQAKHLTQGDQGAFARALDTEITGAEKDLKTDVARQVYNGIVTIGGTDYVGSLGKITNVAGAVFTLSGSTAPEMRYFWKNQLVDVINGTTGAVRGSATVTAVSASATTVTVDAAPGGSATNDYLARSGSFGKEINGLRKLISTSAKFANVDPANEPAWAAVAVGDSTTGVSEVFFDQLVEGVETDGDGATPSLYLSDHLQRRKLASMLQAQKRYDGKETTLTAGWKGLQIAQGTLVADRFNPTTSVFALTPSEISRFVGLDWSWDEDDGKILYKALDGSDAVEARYKAYIQLVATTRNAHAIGTLQVPTF